MNDLAQYNPTYSLYALIFPNNKIYVGITSRLPEHRWGIDGRGYKSSKRVYSAIRKYGWDNIAHRILLPNLPKELACLLEKTLIQKWRLQDKRFGYNVSNGGESSKGFHHSEEFKQSLRDRPISQEQREQISNTLHKRWKEGRFSNAKTFKEGHIPWNKGLTTDDPRVAKYAHKKGEFHHTEESKRRMSVGHKGKPAHNRKQVLCVETGEIFNSVVDAQTQKQIGNISLAARNSNRTSGGYHWRYIE